jgi:hypothetical protein
MSVSLLVLASHLVADFPLQMDWIANNKRENSLALLLHVYVHATVTAGALFTFTGLGTGDVLACSLGIAVTHGAIDTRRWAEPQEWMELYPILIDQIMHIAAIAIVVSLVL